MLAPLFVYVGLLGENSALNFTAWPAVRRWTNENANLRELRVAPTVVVGIPGGSIHRIFPLNSSPGG
jgi:hypothetical protein